MKWKIGHLHGDWGLGIGDWGLGPIPNPQSPENKYMKKLKKLN
jgi:hypothetical protein